jgi:uncharacterized protein involved in exopolysaccharide biosynthesis
VSRQALGRERTDRLSLRDPHYVTLLQLCNDLLRRTWTVVALVAFAAAGAGLLSLARPRTYTTTASFVPEARQPLSQELEGGSSLERMSGPEWRGGSSPVSRLLSVSGSSRRLSGPAPAQPLDPAFYHAMILSPQFIVEVARSRLSVMGPTGLRMGTAADLYGLPPGPALSRIEDAARRLAREITVSYAERTGVLTFSVRTFDPVFSQAVASRLLDVLMERNRRMADSRTEAQVAFLARATVEARQDLRHTQDRLARFLQMNRAYLPTSPLATAYRRLDSDVLDARRRYADLALQLERAKLDRSYAAQLITVVVSPEMPSGPDPRGSIRTTITGAVGGGALALLIVLTSAQLARLRIAGSRDLSALEDEWRAVRRRRGAGASGASVSASGAVGSSGPGI